MSCSGFTKTSSSRDAFKKAVLRSNWHVDKLIIATSVRNTLRVTNFAIGAHVSE
jgi:hypothetical protein